jgi:choline kinase
MIAGVILGGGEGKRMGSVTAESPNVLLKYRGKPLVDYSLECLQKAQVEPIYVVVGHKADLVCHYLAKKKSRIFLAILGNTCSMQYGAIAPRLQQTQKHWCS